MADIDGEHGPASRRRILAGAVGVVGVAAGLTACGSGGSTGTGGNATGGQPGGGTPTGPLAKATDIPVGGGKVFADQNVVVTQPAAGQFKAFGATCTHQGCQVQSISDGLINCPCHGSQYSITDGSVQTPGPGLTKQTQRPLPAKTVTVTGGEISLS